MHSWLSGRKREAVSTLVAACTAVVLLLVRARPGGPALISVADMGVFDLFAYLLSYLAFTVVAFSTASAQQIRTWAEREDRGTVMQRYFLGTAPGPGVSIFIAAAALVVAVVWRPGHMGSALPWAPRVVVALALVASAWACVLVSFAVAFHADNLLENEKALEFPGGGSALWADYVYFAVSVMATFGTTDVNVTSRKMRRTVATNAVIAFVFNTVTVASLVGALTSH
ncbi:DUF1345 domain-containing protein [Streptomyces sp. NK08204]|uniref:DUF1345 domain-containing protein n=1 Tax=Streptomyces sp. NK08204 TaxID=2873260 RepID=UPI001CED33F2|nr:DUF1345 domain-containing protein [Streptomyces sp. NK08204]